MVRIPSQYYLAFSGCYLAYSPDAIPCILLHTLRMLPCILLHTLRMLPCILLHTLWILPCILLHTLWILSCILLHTLWILPCILLYTLLHTVLDTNVTILVHSCRPSGYSGAVGEAVVLLHISQVSEFGNECHSLLFSEE